MAEKQNILYEWYLAGGCKCCLEPTVTPQDMMEHSRFCEMHGLYTWLKKTCPTVAKEDEEITRLADTPSPLRSGGIMYKF